MLLVDFLYTTIFLLIASSLPFLTRWKFSRFLSCSLSSVASILMIASSILYMSRIYPSTSSITLRSATPYAPWFISFSYDWLTAVFTLMLGVVSLAVSVYSFKYLETYEDGGRDRLVGACTSLFILSMYLVLTASNVFWFFVSWELMTIISLVLVLTEYEDRLVRFSGLLYAVVMHVGSALLLIGIALLASLVPGNPVVMNHIAHAIASMSSRAELLLPLTLITLGCLFKAGVVPFHIWLPDAHSSAPTNASALLSGVMVKMGVYGVIRFVLIIMAPCISVPFAVVIMGLGALSAIIGSLYSFLQDDYKRLLAFSTVENMGIITACLGASMLGASLGLKWLYGLALASSIIYAWNHSLSKSLMFLNAGVVLRITGTRRLSQLGGLKNYTPITYITSLLGSASMAALPPFNIFASKLLVYQVLLMTAFAVGAGIVRLISLLSALSLIATGVFALAAFSKLVGSCFLGAESSVTRSVRSRESLAEVSVTMMLLIISIASAIALPFTLSLALKFTGAVPVAITSYGSTVLLLGGSVWSKPITVSFIALSVIMLVAYGAVLLSYKHGGVERRFAPPFVSGVEFGEEHKPDSQVFTEVVREYASYIAGLKKFLRREYAVKYWTDKKLEYRVYVNRHLLDPEKPLRDVGEFFERVLYTPICRFFVKLGGYVRRLQNGSLLLYTAYIYIAYMIVMGVVLCIMR